MINAGIDVQGKNVYFKRTSNPNTPNLTLKDVIASKADIKGETKKSIDIAKYHSALLDVVNAAVDMYAYKVHELFPDSKPIQEEIIPAVEGSAAEENQQIQTEGTAPAESVEDRKTEENVEEPSVPSVPAEPAIPAQESQ
ncbi:MAG: hypothetical protein BWY26_01526 [Elusimicrobia bacterium ADurb.Bin231]|nr:MAG: hypothetical protein BWY26_01526 [Elusimicrobia bacterium ADurb.Bin231]